MTEKEKVILGLECCIRKMEGQRVCDECPYDEDFNCLGCSIVLWQATALLKAQQAAEQRIRARIAAIAPDVEGVDGAEFDIGCIQGMRWALLEMGSDKNAHEG